MYTYVFDFFNKMKNELISIVVARTERWGAGVVICLERGTLPLTVSCFSKIQIGFTFLVPAHPDSPGQMAVKRTCIV